MDILTITILQVDFHHLANRVQRSFVQSDCGACHRGTWGRGSGNLHRAANDGPESSRHSPRNERIIRLI